MDYYNLHKGEGQRVVVDVAYEDIAKHIGVSIRTVGRSIQKLKDLDEVLSEKKKMIITEDKYRLLVKRILMD